MRGATIFGLLAAALTGLACAPEGVRPDEEAGAMKADSYVAVGGSDSHPGTAAKPWATLGWAQEAVRRKVAVGLTADLTVCVRGGTYELPQTLRFGPEDGGTQGHAVTWAAWPGETVVLSGGRRIAGWHKGDGPIWTVEIPDVKAGRWTFRQLFVNGRRAVRARDPNADARPPYAMIRASSVRTPDAAVTFPNIRETGFAWKGGAPNDGTFTVAVDRPIRAWRNAEDVEFIYIYNNDGSRKRVGSVDAAGQTFTLPPPHAWPPKFLPQEYQIGYPLPGIPCWLENALEFLDQPGEWYLDRRTGVLSYWPREGEDLARAEVVAPRVRGMLLAVAGTAARPVRNLRFRGFHVEQIDWPMPEAGFTAMFGCLQVRAREKPEPSAKFEWIEAAVSFEFTRGCDFTDGGVAHAGGIGLALGRGTAESAVERCEFHDLGGGAIVAGGIRNRDTLRWADPFGPGDHRGYRITNNHIHDCGTDFAGAIGVFIGSTQEALVAHNRIHDIAYSGIVLSGNEDPALPFCRDNTVEYNDIYRVLQGAVDGAGIYVSFPQAGKGALIRGNLVHDCIRAPFGLPATSPVAGIYLDGVRRELGVSGYHFEHNVVYRVPTPLNLWQCDKEANTWVDNTFLQDAEPPADVLEAARAKAGLEAAYRK